MKKTAALLTLVCVCAVSRGNEENSNQNEDEEFILAFTGLQSYGSTSSYSRTVSATFVNPSDSSVQVEVQYRGDFGSDTQFTVAAGDAHTHTLPDALILDREGLYSQCALITASASLILHASIVYSSGGQKGSAMYNVLPLSSLGKEYIAATHCEDYYCYLLVTSYEDDNDVTVLLRITPYTSSTYTATFRNQKYVDNEQIVERLDRGGSLQVTCYRCDLTGTLVTATYEVSVTGAGDYTLFSPNRNYRDIVAEQMVPTATLGTRYVLGSAYASLLRIVKVVPLHSGQSLTIQGSPYLSTRDRQVITLPPSYDYEVVDIVSAQPLLVVEVVAAQSSRDEPDSSMLLPLPVSLWSTSYQVYSHVASIYQKDYVCLLSPEGTQLTVSFGGSTVDLTAVSPGVGYSFQTLSISLAASFTVHCKAPTAASCQPFTGFFIHNADSQGSAFSLYPFPYPTATTTTQTSAKPTTPRAASTPSTNKVPQLSANSNDPDTTPYVSTGTPLTSTTSTVSTTTPATTSVAEPAKATDQSSTETTTTTTTTTTATTTTTTTETTISNDASSERTTTTTQEQQQTSASVDVTTSENDVSTQDDVTATPSEPGTAPTHTSEDVTTQDDVTATPSEPVTAPTHTSDDVTTQDDVTATYSEPVTAPTHTSDDVSTRNGVTPTTSPLPTTTTTTTTATSTTQTGSSQRCSCIRNGKSSGNGQETRKIGEIQAAIRKELLEDRTTLSAHIRSKTSANDDRISSIIVGSTLGIAFFLLVFGGVVCLDAAKFVNYLKTRMTLRRNGNHA